MNNNRNNITNQPKRRGFNPHNSWKPYKFFIFITLIFLIPWIVTFISGVFRFREIEYFVFLKEMENDNIESINIKGEEISGKFRSSLKDKSGKKFFKTYLPYSVDKTTLDKLNTNNVKITTRPSGGNSFFSIVLNVLPFALIFWIFYRTSKTMKEQGQNLFQIGKSKAKKFKRDRTNTTFNDVAGLEGVIEELKEVVDFLKNPEKYIRLGAKTPKGILLFPGIFPWVLHSNYRMVINIFTVNHI